MISHLKIKNFTVFEDANFSFADGVNVIIGSNGAGKSHLLKLAYTAARWSQEMARKEKGEGGTRPDKLTQQKELGGKFVRVFRPDGLGRLTSRRGGVRRTSVEVGFKNQPKAGFRFSFSTKSATEVNLDKTPDEFFNEEAVFFPTKEMLSMFPGFTGLYRDKEISIDETYFDLCLALEKTLLKGRRFDEVNDLLAPVEKILGGQIRVENGRFYLVQESGGRFEIPLVAEGFRKLGAVAYLLANGTLAKQSILFWDEPETNLNPAYMARVAELLVAIARNGTQVFVATHSLFIMRELSMLLGKTDNSDVKRCFIALESTDGGAVAKIGESAEEIEPINALDAEIEQSQRYMELSH